MKHWQKSLLFEVVDIEAQQVEYQFTLTIPPESIDFSVGQRVSRTKTFGGVFIDDYGTDNPKLTIAGNTGGVTVRESWPNYTNERGGIGLSGKDAIFELRDKIALYKDSRPGNYQKYMVRVYDLSSVQAIMYGISEGVQHVDAYECSLDDFRISRNKDRPLWYNYSIELFVVRMMGQYRPKNAKADFDIQTVETSLFKALGDIEKIRNALLKISSDIKAVTDFCDSAFKAYDDALREVDFYIAQFSNFTNLVTYPAVWLKKALTRAVALKSFVVNIPGALEDWASGIAGEYADVADLCNQLIYVASAGVAVGKSSTEGPRAVSSVDILGGYAPIPGTAAGEGGEVTTETPRSMVFAGTITVSATGADTLESLAAQYYGDASMAVYIAQYNGIPDAEKIEVGMTIKIPVLTADPQVLDNRVYDTDHVDPYGADISLDATGSMVISESGDFGLVAGMDNLIQAINLRLSEELGARIRLTTYGLISSVGTAMTDGAPIAYILANITDTVRQDPRVKSISNITLEGSGDTLYYSFDIVGIDGDNTNITGAF